MRGYFIRANIFYRLASGCDVKRPPICLRPKANTNAPPTGRGGCRRPTRDSRPASQVSCIPLS